MLLYKTIAVLVSGPIGAGKTTFSNFLGSHLVGNYPIRGLVWSFAAPIKEIAKRYMGWDGNKDEKGRKLLQMIGTDCGREYNKDVWVSYLVDKYLPSVAGYPFDFVIIDDWRFPNEKDYMENSGLYDMYPIRIVRDCCEPNNHASENALPSSSYSRGTYYYTGGIIYNTSDLLALQRSAMATAEKLVRKYNKGVK